MASPEQQSGCTLEDLRRTVEVTQARMEAKLDAIVEHLRRSDNDIADLQDRLTAVERKVYTAAGAAAFIGMAVPYIAQTLGS